MDPVERTTTDALIRQVAADRARFDEVVSRIPRARLAEPILAGGWSVKDVLAHVAWGEREAIGIVRARALVGSELWDLTEDERNEAVVRASRSRTVDDVLGDYQTTFDEYTCALAELSDEDLNDARRIRGLAERVPGWPPWRVLYDPDHYALHGAAIEAAIGDGE